MFVPFRSPAFPDDLSFPGRLTVNAQLKIGIGFEKATLIQNFSLVNCGKKIMKFVREEDGEGKKAREEL